MAPAATGESASMDAISQPPPGIILPPKEIRSILEKTAGYVARNGASFEDRIRTKEKTNPKFSFMAQNDPYHAFYEWRLSEIKVGRGTAVSAGRVGEASSTNPEQPKGPEPPEEFHFSARMPNISAQDLDIVRLTAFYVAKNGRSFMTSLAQREASNYQFDFLRANHSLYQFFDRLVGQYTELLNPRGGHGAKSEKARIAELTHNVQDKLHILGRAKQRAEWVRYQQQQKQKEVDDAEAEKVAYAQVDWHDFVVVETVVFNEADEETELPPPTSMNDLQSASLEQKAMTSLHPSMRIEEAMPTDDYYTQPVPPPYYPPAAPPSSLPARPSVSPAPPPSMSPMPPPSFSPMPPPTAAFPAPGARPPQNAPMKIRNDYVPRAQAARKTFATAICPNCKQTFPVDEIDEHMRVELLDPRWREQKAKADSRAATTNLSTADVAANLKRLASQRTDVFDSVTGEALSAEELARRKKAAVGQFDGVIKGVNDGSVKPGQAGASKAALTAQAREKNAQGKSIEDQLRHIQEKARGY